MSTDTFGYFFSKAGITDFISGCSAWSAHILTVTLPSLSTSATLTFAVMSSCLAPALVDPVPGAAQLDRARPAAATTARTRAVRGCVMASSE